MPFPIKEYVDAMGTNPLATALTSGLQGYQFGQSIQDNLQKRLLAAQEEKRKQGEYDYSMNQAKEQEEYNKQQLITTEPTGRTFLGSSVNDMQGAPTSTSKNFQLQNLPNSSTIQMQPSSTPEKPNLPLTKIGGQQIYATQPLTGRNIGDYQKIAGIGTSQQKVEDTKEYKDALAKFNSDKLDYLEEDIKKRQEQKDRELKIKESNQKSLESYRKNVVVNAGKRIETLSDTDNLKWQSLLLQMSKLPIDPETGKLKAQNNPAYQRLADEMGIPIESLEDQDVNQGIMDSLLGFFGLQKKNKNVESNTNIPQQNQNVPVTPKKSSKERAIFVSGLLKKKYPEDIAEKMANDAGF